MIKAKCVTRYSIKYKLRQIVICCEFSFVLVRWLIELVGSIIYSAIVYYAFVCEIYIYQKNNFLPSNALNVYSNLLQLIQIQRMWNV